MSPRSDVWGALDTDTESTQLLPYLVFAAVAVFFLKATSGVIFGHVANGHAPWNTDFAIFRQAGVLIAHGELGQVYQYVAPTTHATAEFGPAWAEYATHRASESGAWGYYYAQAPWQAFLMVPFAMLGFREGYLAFTFVMVASMVIASLLLVRYTNRGWAWGSAFLLAPLVVPVVAANPWQTPQYHLISLASAPLRYGSPLGLSLWYGQYTPFLLCLLVGALVATYRKQMAVAALLIVVAMAKPTVLFVLPAFLLMFDDFDDIVDLARWGVVWTAVFNIAFMLEPTLGYPWSFWTALTSYSGVTIPILFQAHNWVLYLGVPVAATALYYDGLKKTATTAE